MRTYLFDASAAVQFYLPDSEKIKKTLKYLREQKEPRGQAVIFIPNFCIAEVFNAFARKLQEKKTTAEGYTKCLDAFRGDIHWGRFLYPYELNRYHIIAADRIIPVEHRLASIDDRDHLSTFDILVIAMACELAFVGRREDTFLLTKDRRMKRVFDELKVFDPSALMIPGPLGKVEKTRWIPPNCLYLPDTSSEHLESVLTRKPPAKS